MKDDYEHMRTKFQSAIAAQLAILDLDGLQSVMQLATEIALTLEYRQSPPPPEATITSITTDPF